MKDLHHHWTATWNALQLQPPAGLYEQLMHAYAEPQRHYHTQQHLAECLELLHTTAPTAQHPGEVAVALWFHDAIYDVRSSRNEERSAEWAVDVLQTAGASSETLARVHALILATKHDAMPKGADQQLLVDIDLAILGACPARFAEYEQQIRQEYAWVPPATFSEKRHAILQGFLDRAFIYSTAFFYDHYEPRARENLRAALQD